MRKITKTPEFKNLERKAHAYTFGNKSWSDWGLLFKFLVVICKLLDKNSFKKEKRKPSAWNKFATKQMKEGKTLKQARKLWKNLK